MKYFYWKLTRCWPHTHTDTLKENLLPQCGYLFSSLSLYIELHDGDLVKALLQRLLLGEAEASCEGLSRQWSGVCMWWVSRESEEKLFV